MSLIRRIVPFGLWPANWGLNGSRRAKAIAEYTLEGYQLQKRLIEIDIETLGKRKDLLIRLLEVDLEFEMIDEHTFEVGKAKIEIKDKNQLELALVELDYRFEKISRRERELKILELAHPDKESIEYKIGELKILADIGEISVHESEKSIATLQDEPWFAVLNTEYRSREDLGSALNFDLDWNEQHIHFLMENGITGKSQEEIIDKWFTALCADIFKDFDETEPPKLAKGMKTSVKIDGDKSEHS